MSLAFWPYCIAMRAYSRSRSSGFDLERLGVGDGAQREIDLDRLVGLTAHRLDELLGFLAGRLQPLAEVDALGLELLHRALDPLVEVGVDHRPRGLDLDEPGEGVVDLGDELWRTWFSFGSRMRLRERLAFHSSTVSNSPRLSETQSSVSSGSSIVCTAVTLTAKSASPRGPSAWR